MRLRRTERVCYRALSVLLNSGEVVQICGNRGKRASAFKGLDSSIDERLLASVQELRKKGMRCYLDTDSEIHRVRYLIENLGLKEYFDDCFSSGGIGFLKSRQEFWAAIHERLGIPEKTEVLVWDDDEENVESARIFGFHADFYSGFDAYQARMNVLVG